MEHHTAKITEPGVQRPKSNWIKRNALPLVAGIVFATALLTFTSCSTPHYTHTKTLKHSSWVGTHCGNKPRGVR